MHRRDIAVVPQAQRHYGDLPGTGACPRSPGRLRRYPRRARSSHSKALHHRSRSSRAGSSSEREGHRAHRTQDPGPVHRLRPPLSGRSIARGESGRGTPRASREDRGSGGTWPGFRGGEGDGVALSWRPKSPDSRASWPRSRFSLPSRETDQGADQDQAVHDADLVVGLWSGARAPVELIGALLRRAFDGDELYFVGAVGTGFSDKTIVTILKHAARSRLCARLSPAGSRRSGPVDLGNPSATRMGSSPSVVAWVESREL